MILGDIEESNRILGEVLERAVSPEDRARSLRLKSRNKFACADFSAALDETLAALETLGVKVNPNPTKQEIDVLFEQVKSEIIAIGFNEILAIPRANDPRIDLIVQLLNDAGN